MSWLYQQNLVLTMTWSKSITQTSFLLWGYTPVIVQALNCRGQGFQFQTPDTTRQELQYVIQRKFCMLSNLFIGYWWQGFGLMSMIYFCLSQMSLFPQNNDLICYKQPKGSNSPNNTFTSTVRVIHPDKKEEIIIWLLKIQQSILILHIAVEQM